MLRIPISLRFQRNHRSTCSLMQSATSACWSCRPGLKTLPSISMDVKSGQTGKDGTFRTTLPVQNVAVIVSKAGYVTPGQQIAEVKKNSETGVSFELPHVANQGKLLVTGAPVDTSISVDGQMIGTLDSNGHFFTEVSPGDHTVEFTKAGFQPKKVSMSFTTGRTEGLDVDLKPISPPSSQASAPPASVASKQPAPDKPPVQPVSPPAEPTVPSADQTDWPHVRDSKDAAVIEAFFVSLSE